MPRRTTVLRGKREVRLKGDPAVPAGSAAAHPEPEEADAEPHQGQPHAQGEDGNPLVDEGGRGLGREAGRPGGLAGGRRLGQRRVLLAYRVVGLFGGPVLARGCSGFGTRGAGGRCRGARRGGGAGGLGASRAGPPLAGGPPAREAEPLGAGASEGSALGASGEAGAPVPVGAGAGKPGARVPPGGRVPPEGPSGGRVPPVEEEGEGEADGEGSTGVAVGEGAAEDGLTGVGAVVPTEVPGPSAVYATGAAYRAQAQVNAQVSAGRRARTRALRSAGVTG